MHAPDGSLLSGMDAFCLSATSTKPTHEPPASAWTLACGPMQETTVEDSSSDPADTSAAVVRPSQTARMVGLKLQSVVRGSEASEAPSGLANVPQEKRLAADDVVYVIEHRTASPAHAPAAAVEVGAELSKTFGLELPHTLAFDYPTISALTGFIAAELASSHSSAATSARTSTPLTAEPARAARQLGEVHAAVVAAVTGVLGHTVADDIPLVAAGLDSLAAVELRNEISRMGQNLVHGFLHLAQVNPFIASSLQPRSQMTSKAMLHAHMPKQDGPEPLHEATERHLLAMGVSAFAFQGTNAHVVMGRCVFDGLYKDVERFVVQDVVTASNDHGYRLIVAEIWAVE
ncbi:hypothetical protein WJX74_004040 [Apatococcus lobatus]|uniref:Polyketide synthase-like phosphopantetheine-binding domain-containing protein n=1 Tax=Apatococcus lobatus TaxID=904363 RepID=A0AAW1RLA7_9CHLO